MRAEHRLPGSVQDGVVYLGHCRQIIFFGIQIVKQIY